MAGQQRYDIAAIRRAVAAQADAPDGGGWMDVPVPAAFRASGVLRVPRGAFEQWAVHRSWGGHLATPWEAVSPTGVKQSSDDFFHTDWMLGAGLEPGDMRWNQGNPLSEELSAAAYAARAEVERRLLGFSCSVLLQGPDVIGAALHPAKPGGVDWARARELGAAPVLVLRDASPGWLDDVLRALQAGGAVIVERGGEMAHLVTELRPTGKGPIVRMQDARRLYPEGAMLDVSSATGRISLREQDALAPASPFHSSATSRFELPLRPARPDPMREGAFGMRLHVGPGPSPETKLSMMAGAVKRAGREFQAYASWHWSAGSSSDVAMLCVYVSRIRPSVDGPREMWTVCSGMVDTDKFNSVSATVEALYMVAPSERPDSPETLEVRRLHDEMEHAWWLRNHSGKDDAVLVLSARTELRDRDEMLEDGEGTARATSDALASYAHTFRHYDIEFVRRGMVERVFTLDPVDSVLETSVPGV